MKMSDLPIPEAVFQSPEFGALRCIELGALIRLWLAAWSSEGRLDPKDLAAFSGLRASEWTKCRKNVLRFLTEDANGMLSSPWMLEALEARNRHRQASSSGGKQKASKRRRKTTSKARKSSTSPAARRPENGKAPSKGRSRGLQGAFKGPKPANADSKAPSTGLQGALKGPSGETTPYISYIPSPNGDGGLRRVRGSSKGNPVGDVIAIFEKCGERPPTGGKASHWWDLYRKALDPDRAAGALIADLEAIGNEDLLDRGSSYVQAILQRLVRQGKAGTGDVASRKPNRSKHPDNGGFNPNLVDPANIEIFRQLNQRQG